MGQDMPLGSRHSSTATDSGSIPALPVSLDHSSQLSTGQGIILSSFETDLFFWGGGNVPSFRIIETESNQVDIGAVAEKLASSSSCQRGWKRTAADSLSGGTQPPLDLVDLGNPRLALGSLNPSVTPFPI